MPLRGWREDVARNQDEEFQRSCLVSFFKETTNCSCVIPAATR